jgi:RNA-directed DNA polymerase
VRALRGSNAAAVIARLNPIIRGWAAYYRTVVAKEIFNSLDHYLWKLVYKWARHTHPNKPTSWVVTRYFGMFNKSRQDRWVFGDRDSGAYLQKFAWTRIVRHQLVTGTASPDDPVLADYWTSRRRRPRLQPPVDRTTQQLLDSQRARCVYCGQLLLHADRPPQTPREWEQWYRGLRKAMDHNAISLRQDGSTHDPQLRLLHAHCQRRTTSKRQASTLYASEP